MTSTVLRLIGDEWKYDEKIAVSVPSQAALKMSTALFAKRLQVPSWSGLTLYHCEGKHPNKIRPTVPISLETNPQREKFGNGTVLWVKVKADQREQMADRRFHESLLQWRKENNIPAILSDGSDVDDFMFEFLSRLNAEDTRDITVMEQDGRAVVEGGEHRGFWAMTFEYHEIQALKDAQEAARADLVEDWLFGAVAVYKAVLRGPLQVVQQRKVGDQEGGARRDVQGDEAAAAAGLQTRQAALLLQEAAAAAVAAKAAKLQQAAPSTPPVPPPITRSVSQPAPAPGTPQGAALGTADVDAIAALIAAKLEVSQALAAEEHRRTSEALEAKLLGVVQQVRQESADLQQSVHLILRDHQTVAQSISDNARLSAERQDDDRLELLDAKLSSVAQELGAAASPAWLGCSDRDADEGVQLLEEQRALLQRMIDEVKLQAAELTRQEEASQDSALRQVVVSALQSQNALSGTVQKLEQDWLKVSEDAELLRQTNCALVAALHQETARVAEREQALADALGQIAQHEAQRLALSTTRLESLGRFGRDVLTRTATLGLHPDLFHVVYTFLEQRLPLPSQFLADPRLNLPRGVALSDLDTPHLQHIDAVLRRMPEVQNYLREQMVDLVLDCGSAHQLCDELCLRLGVASHAYWRTFARHVEQHAPHLHAGVDLLLAMYEGREVELFSNVAGLACTKGTVHVFVDPDTQRPYYTSPLVPGVTQWFEPFD